MSRTTKSINQIKADLDRISGLDGTVADTLEQLARDVHKIVEEIEANISDDDKGSFFI